MPNQPKTPNRAFRVDDDLWYEALEVAESHGTNLSEVIREALRRYVATGGRVPSGRELTRTTDGPTLKPQAGSTKKGNRVLQDTELMTTEDLAEMLRKPPSWVFNNAGPLGIPRYKLGNHYRYKRSKVLAWLEEQEER